MTNSLSDEHPPNGQASSGAGFYPLTATFARELRSLKLTAADWRLWSYLATLDPFGEEYHELPDTLTVMRECGLTKSAFYRALATLQEAGLFDSQPVQILFRNLKGAKKFLPGNSLKNGTEVSKMGIQSQKWESSPKNETILLEAKKERSLEPSPSGAFDNEQNEDDVPIVLKNLKEEQTNGSPTHHPVLNEQSETGTNAHIWEQLAAADIAPNKTIQKVLGDLQNQQGAAATLKAVENAISALQEQQNKGTVRNPGGFITAALRRGFTANQAKKEHRERSGSSREARSHSSPGARSTASPGARSHSGPAASSPPTQTQSKPPTRPPLDTHALFASVHLALQQNDRQFALAKLQHYWFEGWQEEVEHLCYTFKRDWGFIITAQGVRDGRT